MREVDIKDVKEIIAATPKSINLMLLGDSGIGKTTVVEEYCRENGIFLKTLILSQLDASEALGVPVTKDYEFKKGKTVKVMEQAIPSWVIDLSKNKKSMLFLDEFLTAEPSVMNSFLNLLSQKRVGPFDLSHVDIVAASNIGMYTFEPDFNILTRFCFIYVVNQTYRRDFPFLYKYEDENKRIGSIFAPRRLVPRCAESLRDVDIKYMDIFYEGFTNEAPIVEEISVGLRQSLRVSAIASQYTSKKIDSEGNEKTYIKDELLKAMCENLYLEFKARSYKSIIDSIQIFEGDQRKRAHAFYDEFIRR